MISRFHNWRRRRKVVLLAAIAGAFLLSASFAVVLNSQGNSGEQVAEAASRVNRQVDDTQEAFTDIKDLIPEEQRLEAAPPASYDHQLTAGSLPPQPQPPAPAGNSPIAENEAEPVAGNGYPEGHAYGINPAGNNVDPSNRADDNDQSGDDPDGRAAPPTLTFNDKAREVQGDEVLTQYQEAMDRIVDNWTPQYEAAKREHEEPMTRIEDTRELWPAYRQEQSDRIRRQGNACLRKMPSSDLYNARDRLQQGGFHRRQGDNSG